MTSHLIDIIQSHLNLKVGDQGLTSPLSSPSKCPKIISMDRCLHAFAIYFSVIVSVYPSRATDLIGCQQLFEMWQKISLGWLGMSVRWNSEGMPPITFLPSGGNWTSSSTLIPLQAYLNQDVDLVAAPTISLISGLCQANLCFPSSDPNNGLHRTISQQSLGQFCNTVVSLPTISTPTVPVMEPPLQHPKLRIHLATPLRG